MIDEVLEPLNIVSGYNELMSTRPLTSFSILTTQGR